MEAKHLGCYTDKTKNSPTVKTKIPQTILSESPGGSGAPVGFINLGSLMDRLSNKGSAQQTMLRATHNSWVGPKYLDDRPEGRCYLRPEGLAEEERRPLPTLPRLSN